ncbi:MAG TPA: acyl-CoA thioesterase [Patescibacteria group bacterium]|jgi:acyl-CoA hydrolase|nr:acyl-CoA thioesterase [Patescibacteria group bacterium]
MAPKKASDSRITLTQLMGPGSANTMGNVHGGYVMKLCDEAGGMAASKHARHQVVTVAVDSMTFHSPVHIGNLMTVTAEITWTGRSSMETRVVVTAEDVLTGATVHTNTAYFVYVALDGAGKPTEVAQLLIETEEDQSRLERAAIRQAYRLKTRE